jgi:hypothetical protein
MAKKAAVLILLLSYASLVFSVETNKHLYWFEFGIGESSMAWDNWYEISLRSGFMYQFKSPYFLSFHASVSENAGGPVDIQYGGVISYGLLRLCPAIGIGYAEVGRKVTDYWGTEDVTKGAVTLPISCDLQLALFKWLGVQATGTVNFTTVRRFHSFYGGIVLGRLR